MEWDSRGLQPKFMGPATARARKCNKRPGKIFLHEFGLISAGNWLYLLVGFRSRAWLGEKGPAP
jgi:hypothetical protein